jgi:hypothetical protein
MIEHSPDSNMAEEAGRGGRQLPVNTHGGSSNGDGHTRRANWEFLKRRQKQLRETPDALAWLEKSGIRPQTIQAFHLGLSGSYVDRSGITHSKALLAPVLDSDGIPINRTVYINMLGVTTNPSADTQWMKGRPRTYFAGAAADRKTVFVCERLQDLWITWQALSSYKIDREILIIASTHGSALPDEWGRPDFWNRFQVVYLGHDNDSAGDEIALHISLAAGREMLRAQPPPRRGKNWGDFWQSGGNLVEFQAALAGAAVISEPLTENSENGVKLGRHEYRPIDIATAFHRGHLYYPVRTLSNFTELVRGQNNQPAARVVTKIETVVVRSDRTIHTVREDPAPRGTAPEDRVLRLTDGTLVEARPKASAHSTWSWTSIKAYREGKSKVRKLGAILHDVENYLRRFVWLPCDSDYALLTLLVPVTYAQAVFQSVPMILVTGPPGSGKSALGRAMCLLCANAVTVGQASAASVARLIHETKGFVVMDDLESVGRRCGKDSPQFSELVQALKLSYSKETSWKIWTNVGRGMKVERLNFFGVKMINNTSGADGILGSRMLHVQMRAVPESLRERFGLIEQDDLGALNSIRDELHTWIFENVALISRTYRESFSSPSDRAAEIIAPLKVFAAISGDGSLIGGLDQAIALRNKPAMTAGEPAEIMREALRRIIQEGYRKVSTTHVVLEMKALFREANYQSRARDEFTWEDPARTGRMMRDHKIIDSTHQGWRQYLFGKSLRIYPVNEEFVRDQMNGDYVTAMNNSTKRPTDFCAECDTCRYRDVGCPLMPARLKVK